MQPDRCLRVCLLGDPGTGHSTFLRSFRGDEGGPPAVIESQVATVELEGEPWLVRFTDNLCDPRYDDLRSAALSSAHVILLCFGADSQESLLRVRERWAPLVWTAGAEAPAFVVCLKADLREVPGLSGCVEKQAGFEAAERLGALGYLECSAVHPETVRQCIDEALAAAKEFYGLQWQLCPNPGFTESQRLRTVAAVADDGAWTIHERLNVPHDARPLDIETLRKGLSTLGRTHSRQHAYLRLDLSGLALTSLDEVRSYVHLQSLNVSKNHLRSLEPLGALRCLLHLDASHNVMIRAQTFTAPDALETVNLSYNMIGDLGDWGVHKYLRELNIRGNFINQIGPGLLTNKQLRSLDLSENNVITIQNLEGLELKELVLAQNQLTSLEGIATLEKLQTLNVRHNNITSIAALVAEDVPRLRKLNISDNRISHITEVARLEHFSFLCELLLAPNPVVELPYYRSQVLHRLPRLRSLDAAPVLAEEKEKADLIYGVDVEARKGIFQELLPQESFVDRRLITEEGIAEMERQHFGTQGDAGPYGSSVQNAGDERTWMQDAKFRQRLELVRSGGEPPGVGDFSDFPAPFVSVTVDDDDLPQILEAVLEGGIQELLLSGASLTTAGVQEVLAVLRAPGSLRHVDLTGCQAVGQLGKELLSSFPYARGCSMEAAECGLAVAVVDRLRNQTQEAEDSLRRKAEERRRTEEMIERYIANQDALEDRAAEHCPRDSPPEAPPPLCHPLKWREGIEAEARAAYKAFRTANPDGLHQIGEDWAMVGKGRAKIVLSWEQHSALRRVRNGMLKEWGCILKEAQDDEEGVYNDETGQWEPTVDELQPDGRPLPAQFEAAFEDVLRSPHLLGFMIWTGVEPSTEATPRVRRTREEWETAWREHQKHSRALGDAARKLYDTEPLFPGAASGQLIAHFTYLACGQHLKGGEAPAPPQRFGLKWLAEMPRPRPRRGEDIHEAVSKGRIAIEAATGQGFGANSVRLKIKNMTSQSCEVAIRQGSIFQHADWQHRQNLLVKMDYFVVVPASGVVSKGLHTYCMNWSCASSNGSPVCLTEFYFDDMAKLESQGLVWDHFEVCFGRK